GSHNQRPAPGSEPADRSHALEIGCGPFLTRPPSLPRCSSLPAVSARVKVQLVSPSPATGLEAITFWPSRVPSRSSSFVLGGVQVTSAGVVSDMPSTTTFPLHAAAVPASAAAPTAQE